MRYRRSQQSGGSFFFTLVTYERQPILTRPDHIDRLRAAFKREIEKYPFALDAIVILPDHLHALWHLPEGDRDFSGRWSRIKRYFISAVLGQPLNNRIQDDKNGSGWFGSDDFGNIPSATKKTGGGISIIFISIQ